MKTTELVLNHIENYEPSKEKFLDILKYLTIYHIENCNSYKSILKKIYKINSRNLYIKNLSDIPLLPVNLFKSNILKSVKNENIFKIIESSGTTGQLTSKIYLDKFNARMQSIALSKIFTDFTGLKRPNILIIDNPDLLRKPGKFSARLAGVIGFRSLCRKAFFGLSNDMTLNIEEISNCLKNSDSEILVYGFTYIIWLYFLSNRLPKELRELFSKKAILLHGGGWKKLENLKVSQKEFKQKIVDFIGIKKIINYYGMVEQTGSIFMECEKGFLHSNPLCDVIARSIDNVRDLSNDNYGLAQVLSTLPTSYPGHSLLTEDLIQIYNTEKCSCGRYGTTFKVLGRISKAEKRGCSDTYER